MDLEKLGEKTNKLLESENEETIPVVSVSLFNESLTLMRDLAEHQNGAPLIRHKEDYDNTMTKVWDFLEANETIPVVRQQSELLSYHKWYLQNRGRFSSSEPEYMVEGYLRR